jgi:methionyl-tRNA formyltransferase
LELTGVLLDDEVVSLKQRQKNLFRNIRANGWSYPVLRIVETICTATTTAVNNAAVSRTEVNRVLKEAFPNTCFSLAELGEKYGMTIHAVGNLNSANAIRVLGECGADLGIVLGTRVLKAGTFAVPRMGCITLHKGKVPEYRGMPPGFWELYDGASSTDVSVRFVEKDLGSGDIVATSAVSIQKKTETPEKLLEKLHEEGSRVLASAVALIRDGKATRQSQGMLESKPRSKPTREDVVFLRRRLPHSKRNGAVSTIVRNLYVLFVYYSGLYFMVRQWHRLSRSRGAIVLYHRVNDYSKDVLTVDCRTFAAQLLAISQRYPFSSTADLVDRILTKGPLQPTTVAIHFDDCYRDILTNGAPIMRVFGIPACAFINSGFVDTSRSFPHDAGYPFTYEMLRSSDVQTWSSLGFEVGAHTVNHVDLGKCAVETANHEIVQCGQDLEKMIGKPVDLFSFPFGRPDNIRAATRRIIQTAGYIASFSAHGGFIGPGTDPYDIPRTGAHYESSPVYCLLQIEGLTLSRIARKFRSIWNSPTRVATQP